MFLKFIKRLARRRVRSTASTTMSSPNDVFTFNSSDTTPPQENRNPWNSPMAPAKCPKPLPRSLLKSFKNEGKITTDSLRVCGEDVEEEDTDEEEQESAKFASFASHWAKEDAARNEKIDMLEALEDCMDTNMRLSDQIVRLITKLKRQLRSC